MKSAHKTSNKSCDLYDACTCGNLDHVKRLVKSHDYYTYQYFGAAGFAIGHGNFDILKFLVAQNKLGEDTIVFLFPQIMEKCPTNIIETILNEMPKLCTNKQIFFSAASYGHLNIVKRYNGNIREGIELALRNASTNGHLDIVKYLVEKGADIHVLYGIVLANALKNGHGHVAEYLIVKGAKLNKSKMRLEFDAVNDLYRAGYFELVNKIMRMDYIAIQNENDRKNLDDIAKSITKIIESRKWCARMLYNTCFADTSFNYV